MSDSFKFKKEHRSKKGGLTESGRKAYNKATGSNLKRPQPQGGSRKRSFCARNKGQIDMHNIDCRKTPEKRACLARKRWKCSKSEDLGKSKNLIHYSPVQNLKEISPKFQGTGADSRARRDTEHPHSFFYSEGGPTETMITDQAKSKYTVKLSDDHKVYDIGSDPMGLKAKAKEENGGAFNKDMVYQKIKENGFHGFHDPGHPDERMRGVVALFHPQKVDKEDKVV